MGQEVPGTGKCPGTQRGLSVLAEARPGKERAGTLPSGKNPAFTGRPAQGQTLLGPRVDVLDIQPLRLPPSVGLGDVAFRPARKPLSPPRQVLLWAGLWARHQARCFRRTQAGKGGLGE